MAQFYDTLLWEYIKNPWRKWLSLDNLASDYFDFSKLSYDELTNKWKIPLSEIDIDKVAKYSAEDAYITNLLYEKQLNELTKDEFRLLNDIEIPLLDVLKIIELNGVRINRELLKDVWVKLFDKITILEKQIYDLAWKEFNINSPKQVWELLFVDMWLPHWKKTKTWYSVNVEVLTDLSREYKIAAYILDYRHYTKLQSTYVDGLLKLLVNTDIIHTSYNQTVTSTWRLSSTNPNLQNIPTWSWLSWEIRKAFIPFEWHDYILAADYSQVEVRLLAILSQDKNLLWAFKQWVDIHQNTANFIFWKDDISSQERKIAKAVNFWVIYWISSFWLAKMIDIPMNEAKLYIDKFWEKYPKVIEYFENTKEFCQKNWYVETLFWRKRFITWINDSNTFIKKAAEREALNMPIQWTAADIIKLAMIKLSKFIIDNNLESKMIMQVHDEIVFSVKNDEVDILKRAIKDIMENIIDYDITLTVDIWVWVNRAEAK